MVDFNPFRDDPIRHVQRVAYVHDTNIYGGVEVYLLLLMKYLDPARYSPVVLVPGYTDPLRGSPPRFIQQVEDMRMPLIRLPVRPEGGGLGFLSQVQKTKQLLMENKFDVIHIHTCRPMGARIPMLSAWLAKIPAIIRTELGPPLGVTSLTRFAVKPFDWLTDNIVVISDANVIDQERLHRDRNKIYRSYCGIELDKFNPEHNAREAKARIGLDPNIPVVGCVGRLMWEKGHKYLISAVPRIIQQYGPVNFLLIGEGNLEHDLRQQAEDLGLSHCIHFTGYVPDKNPYMEAIDIGVMPSLMEGFGLALAEFMALGIPTVTSPVPCFYEVIVDGESGIIASLEEKNSLADHILELLCDPEKASRIGRAGLERVRAQFGIQRLANDMMDLYDRVIESESSRISDSRTKLIPTD